MRTLSFILAGIVSFTATSTHSASLECNNWESLHPEWLWCDDFEDDSALEQNYFEVKRADGRYGVRTDHAFGGSGSLRSDWSPGTSDAGNLKLSFGKTPVAPTRYTDQNFDEVYWRFYMMVDERWQGQGNKVARATIFSGNNWSQAMIGHVWQGSELNLAIDPVSGTARPETSTDVITTRYNDFDNFKWLGKAETTTNVYAEDTRTEWFCIETSIKLNSLGQTDGNFKMWINDSLEAERSNLNWRSSFDTYGINAIFLENYKGGGSSNDQSRYIDNFIVSTERIGCASPEKSPPITPPNLDVEEKIDSQ